MILMRDVFDAALIYVAAFGLGTALLTIWTVRSPFEHAATQDREPLHLSATLAFAGALAWLWTGDLVGTLLAASVSGVLSVALRIFVPRLTIAGAQEMALSPLVWLASTPWTYFLLRDHGFPSWVLVLPLLGAVLALAPLAFFFAAKLARQALLTHATWERPAHALAPFAGRGMPRVSIQVPAYAEPPEIVIAVLDRLARLDYPNFEVMVCDNNTEDERLWRPVEAHCARLNRESGIARFRFFHVAPLAGAKAGALNFCLKHMDPAAGLVAVLDADYLAEPDFLSRLTGFFDDPEIGYLQTPHDYRGFANNPYLRACYWEYMPNNKIELPGINEYGAAFTIGTMCILRTEGLREAGGWAEWCLTEDSEVSVRLRAVGYSGVYLRETFGRGLIPETFEAYRKQRFRWTAGPVQQLRRHWRLYVPRVLGGTSQIGGWSKLLEVQRGAEPVLPAVAMLSGLMIGAFTALLTAAGIFPVLVLPDVFWLSVAISLVAFCARRWQRYSLSGCLDLGDMIMGEVARLSLTYVQMIGGVAGLSTRPLAWRRTSKFKAQGSVRRALSATLPETALGVGQIVLLLIPVSLGETLGWHFVALVALGGGLSAASFLAAPAMALLGERQLRVKVPRRVVRRSTADQPVDRALQDVAGG